MEMLKIRKLADKSVGERVTRYHPETGEAYLTNPATPGNDPEPWPLAGIKFEGEPPSETSASMRWVLQGVAEGWLELVGEKVMRAPGGPPQNPWSKVHTFHTARAIKFKTVAGAVTYQVTHNPGKYDDASEPAGTRVDWFYRLRREV